jgi:hypothetical protein
MAELLRQSCLPAGPIQDDTNLMRTSGSLLDSDTTLPELSLEDRARVLSCARRRNAGLGLP